MTFGGTEQDMHLFQHLGKFSMHLFIPVLLFDYGPGFGEETPTNFDDRIVFVVSSFDNYLEDAAFIGSIECHDRKNARFAAHLMNFVRQLAKLLLYLFRIWE